MRARLNLECSSEWNAMSFRSSVAKVSVFLLNVSDITALEDEDVMLSSNQVRTQN